MPERPDRRHARILYVIGSLDVGGSERHLAAMAPRLRQHGWQTSIYCLSHRGALADGVEAKGVAVIGTPDRLPARSRLLRLSRLAFSCLALFFVLLRRRPQIVHFFLPMAYIVGGTLAVLARIPTRIMSRRSLNHYQKKHPGWRRIEKRLHAFMHAIVGNSNAVMRDLLNEGCDPKHLVRIYNGIDSRAIAPAATPDTRSGPYDAETFSILIVANLIPYKGHADLFRALALISASLPRSWTLSCAGRDDGIALSLRELARTLGIEAHIRMLGERNDIATLLHASDIAVISSHEEGFSNAVLEAMAAGVPMVVTDVGGNAEAVLDGETGFVVASKDPDALGQAILKLAFEPDLRRRMGSKARQRAQEVFSMDRCVSEYDALYRSFVA